MNQPYADANKIQMQFSDSAMERVKPLLETMRHYFSPANMLDSILTPKQTQNHEPR
jgi:hypothetical protein